MRVVLPAEHYDRASGALSCAMPALLFLIINVIGSAISPFILLLMAIDFVPLVAFGYGLDLVFRVLPRKLREARARSPWAAVKVIVSWVIAFPLARTIANFLRGLLEGSELTAILWGLLLDLPYLLVFGLFFGVFFTVAYSFFARLRWRIARRRAMRRPTKKPPEKAREVRQVKKRRKP